MKVNVEMKNFFSEPAKYVKSPVLSQDFWEQNSKNGAGTGDVIGSNRSVMRLDEFPCDGQSQSVAFCGAGLVGTVHPLKDMWKI